MHKHHILKKQRARGEKWIDSPLNLVELSVKNHGIIHAASTNEARKEYSQKLYKHLWNNILDWNEVENLFQSSELIAIRDVYMYCTIGAWRKEFKPDARTFAVYRVCCEKMQEYYKRGGALTHE